MLIIAELYLFRTKIIIRKYNLFIIFYKIEYGGFLLNTYQSWDGFEPSY